MLPSDNHLSGGPDRRLLDVPDGEEIRESPVNDGNIMRKSRPRKKRSGVDATATSVPVIGDEACSKEYEHSDSIKGPTTDHVNPQELPLDAELDGENIVIIQSSKASKLHPRRWNTQTVKEVQQTQSEAPRQATRKRQRKKDNILSDAADDHLSPLSDPTCLADVMRAMEAGSGISAMKGKESTSLSGSSCPVQAVNLEPPVNSDRNTDVQLKENTAALEETDEDNMTLASFLQQHGADTTGPSSTNLTRKRKKSSQLRAGSNSAAAPILNSCKRRKTGDGNYSEQMLVEEGWRNDDQAYCKNEALKVETGDDVTLAQFLQQIRGKKTDCPKIQPPL